MDDETRFAFAPLLFVLQEFSARVDRRAAGGYIRDVLRPRDGGRAMFRTKCPLCGGTLTIDERLRRVVSHVSKEESAKKPEERLESVMEKIEREKSQQDSKLEEAKRRESERKRHVEDLFKKAQDKAKEDPEGGKPVGPVWS
jgi:uncharacterized Zn finger protein (UPF0148 family)